MDDSSYPIDGINGTSETQTYPYPTAISGLPQALSPLPPPTAAMQPFYDSHPHTPRMPGTPNKPNSATNALSYQKSSQPDRRLGIYSMSQDPYPPDQGYRTSAPIMPQGITAASHPRPIAPAPVGRHQLRLLRPMRPGIMAQPGVSSPYGPGSLMQRNPAMHDGEQPAHVVGCKDRHGILPGATGCPTAPTSGTCAKPTAFEKDADGRFLCPHCTKTYLKKKHLRRHLVCHTGDRPYICVLCRETFSRSDVLKRHFKKCCSIRRDNPKGASPLSHPEAHVKQNAQAHRTADPGNEGDLDHFNGLHNMPVGGMIHPFGVVPVSDGIQLSRSNSMNNQQMPRHGRPPGQNGVWWI